MIGKVGLGSNPKGILQYCYYEKQLTGKQASELTAQDVRGELVYIQHLGIQSLPDGRLDLDYLARQMTGNHEKNRKLTKFIWHQSFSFPPGEKPSAEQITRIATEFAKDFGFEDNQLLVFRHSDTAHSHFHIVANRINYNGRNTADHFNNYARNGLFCRKMEQQLGLSVTPGMRITQRDRQQVPRADQSVLKLKGLIDSLLAKSPSMEAFKQALQEKGYKTYVGRGISFFNMQNRMKVKGSDIGREYSLAGIEKWLTMGGYPEMAVGVRKKRRKRKRKGLSIS